MRPHDRVEVVGHRAIAEDLHGQTTSSDGDGLDEGDVVGGLIEDVGTAVAPVQGTVDHPADGGSRFES